VGEVRVKVKSRWGYHRNRARALLMLLRMREYSEGWQLGVTTPSMVFIDIDRKDLKYAVRVARLISLITWSRAYVFITRNGHHIVSTRELPSWAWKSIYLLLYITGVGDRKQAWVSLKRRSSTLRVSPRRGKRPILVLSVFLWRTYEELLG